MKIVDITVHKISIPLDAQDKINTTLAGGDLPDVMMLLNDTSRTELVQQAGESGMFWDLTEILEDYPLLKENTEPYLRSLTYDGNLIAMEPLIQLALPLRLEKCYSNTIKAMVVQGN